MARSCRSTHGIHARSASDAFGTLSSEAERRRACRNVRTSANDVNRVCARFGDENHAQDRGEKNPSVRRLMIARWA